MYEPPMPSSKGAQTAGPLHGKRRRSRGLSAMSAFSLTQGGYDPGEMMWEDRVWLLGYRWVCVWRGRGVVVVGVFRLGRQAHDHRSRHQI